MSSIKESMCVCIVVDGKIQHCSLHGAAEDYLERLIASQMQVERLRLDQWKTLPDEDGEDGITWGMAFADHDMLLHEAERERDECKEALNKTRVDNLEIICRYADQRDEANRQLAAVLELLIETVRLAHDNLPIPYHIGTFNGGYCDSTTCLIREAVLADFSAVGGE